ncbi:hypothetical protein TNCV_1818351 [Trichonephila clavipes]|nr:hypothetical protein TNCV_1818351 [Trichonephila clavipes]
MTDAYSVDFTDCSQVADVHLKWLTWLDDWEMHRDDPVPWRMVGLRPWKRALEKHVQRSHEKALAHGMPSDEDGKDPKVVRITVDHSNLLTTAKDSRANRYINERLSLKSHLPGSVPLEYLDFCVRGKFCHLAQGNRGLIVIKGSGQGKIFEKLGLFTINLEILPNFRDLNDRTLPNHLHDEVHEDYGISECTMVKSYRFARYLQHFNKLQAECKRQTAHLVE